MCQALSYAFTFIISFIYTLKPYKIDILFSLFYYRKTYIKSLVFPKSHN